MTKSQKELAIILGIFMALGAGVDFLFNGVAMKVLFHREFKEAWFFIYAPTFFAIMAASSTYLAYSRWHTYASQSVIGFIFGVLISHLSLVGHHSNRIYWMNLIAKSPFLLGSNDWPQILLVTDDGPRKALLQHDVNDKIPVNIEVITDYGCNRRAVVSTIAGVDVKNDDDIAWTWRVNIFTTTSENRGPGMEDLRFPWCRHEARLKMQEDGPFIMRPWDEVLKSRQKGEPILK